ncbi:hypothetical protein PhCBS80983_g02819 [Powellomyces hirtus]|uniref:Transmembrane protein n=1 Tax=Powellomyces hirtus TaxID=109895 RepID=A0A507E4G9_9FUNG|nr:hypothetical protein PhCBS80983_g02819 [Powellomyces hirtus]
MPSDSNLIQAISSNARVAAPGQTVNAIINVSYPVLVLLTSIPVSIIIVKLNLVSSRLCTGSWAQLWAAGIPFLAALPFQTGAWVTDFSNWTSLVFQSTCNFAAPFLVFLYLPRRNLVMQQSVLDELEFLDLDAGVKRWREDDDDFDYVYHLPHADLTRLGMRRYDPFAPAQPAAGGVGGGGGGGGGLQSSASLATGHQSGDRRHGGAPSIGGASNYHLGPKFGQSVSQLSTASGQSARQLMKQMLGPGGGGNARRRGRQQSMMPNANPGDGSSRRTSVAGSSMNLGVPGSGGGGGRSAHSGRRLSTMLIDGNMNRIHPMVGNADMDDVEAKGGDAKLMADATTAAAMATRKYIEDTTGEMGQFKAMPYWLSRRVHPNYIAGVALSIMLVASLVVLVLDVKEIVGK